eukprot:m.61718 g.61718  ORF g.61718 m.61718 type:complete len:118 (+) comp11435_c1_seq1:119-472(+)
MNRDLLEHPIGQQYALCMDNSCGTKFTDAPLHKFPPAPSKGDPIIQGCSELLEGTVQNTRIVYCGYGWYQIPQIMDIPDDSKELILAYTSNLIAVLTKDSFAFYTAGYSLASGANHS